MNFAIDVRAVLPAIRVPTLILHRAGDSRSTSRTPLPGRAHPRREVRRAAGRGPLPGCGDTTRSSTRSRSSSPASAHASSRTASWRPSCSPTSSAPPSAPRRSATSAGASSWRSRPLVARRSSTALPRTRGQARPAMGSSPRSTGRPRRPLRHSRSATPCAPLGIEIRAGLHTGECELIGDDIGGIAVHIGRASRRSPSPARCSSPAPSRIWSPAPASTFEDRGTHRSRESRTSGASSACALS